jgi:hypothetical protein
MFQYWIDNGTPVVVWLPGFFFTQSFLTAVLQNFARKYKLAVDSLKFSYKILGEAPTTKPEDGCCMHGLYLDGGRWNAKQECVADPQPKVMLSDVPCALACDCACRCCSTVCPPPSCYPCARKPSKATAAMPPPAAARASF